MITEMAGRRNVGRCGLPGVAAWAGDAADLVKTIRDLAEVTDKSVTLTGSLFNAVVGGPSNGRCEVQPVCTQKDRADLFRPDAQAIEAIPDCVGRHRLQHTVEPKRGRLDGENRRLGLVCNRDRAVSS
ncbi:MAG TPA: hypothetical protein VGS41_10645 [Chthonomonadales bacterium]|nr:hypothetical protein [Chthonomonadales bacterium]